MNFGVKPQKQTVFIAKSTKKQFLFTNSGMITSILVVSGLKLHSSSTELVNFLEAQSSFGGGTSSDLGGTVPDCPPFFPVAPGLLLMFTTCYVQLYCLFTSLYFVSLRIHTFILLK